MPDLNVLALDTATSSTVVALEVAGEDATFEARHDPSPDQRPAHAAQSLALVDQVLRAADRELADVELLAVGVGPGSFTGLRIGVATARALATARGLPVHPVCSLAALAAGADVPLVLAVIDARRGEVFAALRDGGRERWPAFCATPGALVERLRSEACNPLAVGDGSIRLREPLEAVGVEVPPDGSTLHVVCALSVCRLAASTPAISAEAVVPHYLRLPDAQPQP